MFIINDRGLTKNSQETISFPLPQTTVNMSVPSLMAVPEKEKLEIIAAGSDENDSDFQEGGIRGWSIVLGA